MPPDYIRHNKHKPSSEDKVDVLMKEIYSNKTLKRELDYALDQGSKIVAIKRLRTVCENLWCPTGEYKIKYNLRNYKDTIDLYETRFIVHNKIDRLNDRIKKWCEENGQDKTSKVNLKDKTGQYTYKYSDWEMVEDSLVNMNKNLKWFPSKKRIERYNKLWKQYV